MSPRGTAGLRNEKWGPSPYQSISTMRTLGPELPPRTATVDRQVCDMLSFLSRFIPTQWHVWLNAQPVIELGTLRFGPDRHWSRSRSPGAMLTCCAVLQVRASYLLDGSRSCLLEEVELAPTLNVILEPLRSVSDGALTVSNIKGSIHKATSTPRR